MTEEYYRKCDKCSLQFPSIKKRNMHFREVHRISKQEYSRYSLTAENYINDSRDKIRHLFSGGASPIHALRSWLKDTLKMYESNLLHVLGHDQEYPEHYQWDFQMLAAEYKTILAMIDFIEQEDNRRFNALSELDKNE